MKKGFLKCLVLSLCLVCSIPSGSLAAKNINTSSNKAKTHFTGVKKSETKKKRKQNKVNSLAYSPKTQFVGKKVTDFEGVWKIPTAYDESAEKALNEIFDYLSVKLRDEYKINFSLSFDSSEQSLKINRNGSGNYRTKGAMTFTLSGLTINCNNKLPLFLKNYKHNSSIIWLVLL